MRNQLNLFTAAAVTLSLISGCTPVATFQPLEWTCFVARLKHSPESDSHDYKTMSDSVDDRNSQQLFELSNDPFLNQAL